jgi:chaperonin cofactor prefoldin
MNSELKQELELINVNLNAAVKNQAEIYVELAKLEKKIKEEPKDTYPADRDWRGILYDILFVICL